MDIFKLLGKIVIEGVEGAKKDLEGVSSKAEQSESKITGAFKKIGAAVITYFATDKIIDFGKACVEATATISAEQSAFEQIMGDYSNTATQKVSEVADATGMVDSRLTPYMTSMTAKFKGLGYDIDDATSYAQDGLMLAADAAAFWDKSLDESMSHLNSFVNGSYEGGEAIGLFANDTQMAAYAVKQGLIEDTKYWASLEEKIKQATRLEYAQNMMKQSGAVGQAAKESGQYANVMANLSEKWRQFKGQVGEPILEKFVLPAVTKLSDFMDGPLQSGINFFSEKVVPVVEEAGDYLGDNFMPIIEEYAEDLFPVIETALENIVPLMENVGYFLKPILEFAEPIFEVTCNGLAYITDELVDLPVTLGIIKDDTYFISEEYLQMSENADKMNDSLHKIADENNQIGAEVLEEYASYQKLSDELQTLVDKNGQIKTHCENRVKQIIEELNPALGTSLEIVDGQLQGYKDISAEIDNIILKKQAETLIERGADNYNEAIANRSTSIKAKVKAEADLEELQKEYAEREHNATLYTDYGILVEGFDFSTNTEEMIRIEAEISSLNAIIETENENIKGFNNNIINYENLQNGILENNVGAMKRYSIMFSDNMVTSGNATLAELQTQYAEYTEIYDQMVEDRENGDQSITDEMLKSAKQRENIAFDEMKKTEKVMYDGARQQAEKYASGIISKNSEVSKAAQTVGETAENGLSFNGAEVATKNMNDYIHAIYGGVDAAIAAAQTVSDSVNFVLSNSSITTDISVDTYSIPHYATGGIVTREHIAKVGENGAEAIIPLERNTEWIDRVAQRMSGSSSNSEISAKLDEMISLLKNQKIYLNGKALVGGIAGDIDKKLGSMARQKRRAEV